MGPRVAARDHGHENIQLHGPAAMLFYAWGVKNSRKMTENDVKIDDAQGICKLPLIKAEF